MAGRWTEEQVAYLKMVWRTATSESILKGLRERGPERTRDAVKVKAFKLGLGERVPASYVKLVDVHPAPNRRNLTQAHWVARKQAMKDGVIKQNDLSLGRPLLVPEWWAEKYAAEQGERERNLKRSKSGWLTAKDFGFQLGLSHVTGLSYLLGTRGPPWFREAVRKIEKFKVGDNSRKWFIKKSEAEPLLRRLVMERKRE